MSYDGAHRKIVTILEKELSPLLTYHNLSHAQRVLNNLNAHIDTLEFDLRKAELVRLAGIGHDIGFIESYEGHEMKSIEILKPILIEESYSKEEIHEISAMIWATKLGIKPHTFMEKMLVDADLEYLGSNDFISVLKTLYQEWVNYDLIPADYQKFLENSLTFSETHSYELDYSKAYSKKLTNIENLRASLFGVE